MPFGHPDDARMFLPHVSSPRPFNMFMEILISQVRSAHNGASFKMASIGLAQHALWKERVYTYRKRRQSSGPRERAFGFQK